MASLLSVHEGLGESGRLPALVRHGSSVSAVELGALVLLGMAAAVVSGVGELRLGLPGHNIIRVVFPMALGLALVPRRGSATVMGLGGMLAAAVLAPLLPRGLGFGAITGLAMMGLLVDTAVAGARSGRAIYVRLTLAGLAANMAAFGVRGGAKLLGLGFAGHVSAAWWTKAALCYPLFGLLAGLISAAVWFRATADRRRGSDGEDQR